VSSGKLSGRSNRACAPMTESVPVPVRSLRILPRSSHEAQQVVILTHEIKLGMPHERAVCHPIVAFIRTPGADVSN
jgi:hypothetical protein